MSPSLSSLPLFNADIIEGAIPDVVKHWKKMVRDADSVLISTPAYLLNIPSALKSALEWLTSSGELFGKRTLAMTYTPHPPRGKEAMQSLIWSLSALDAHIVGQCAIYQTELKVDEQGNFKGEGLELLEEGIKLIT